MSGPTAQQPSGRGKGIRGFCNLRMLPLDSALRWARRLIIFVVGMTVLLIGLVMTVAPGPAIVVIPIGLAILGVEFAWARRLLRRIKEQVQKAIGRGRAPDAQPSGETQTAIPANQESSYLDQTAKKP